MRLFAALVIMSLVAVVLNSLHDELPVTWGLLVVLGLGAVLLIGDRSPKG